MLEALQDIYKEARNGNLPYKTLVIDTGDRLWDMCARQVIRDYNASPKDGKISSIESIGYGKGYAQASEMFVNLLSVFDNCRSAGLHIAVICHCRVETVNPPEGEAYTMYTIKINAPAKQAITAKEKLKEWGDAILFCNYVTTFTDGGKAKGGELRAVYTEHRATWEAKNRHGMPAVMAMDAGEISRLLFGEGCGPSGKIHTVRQKRAACRAWVHPMRRRCSNCKHELTQYKFCAACVHEGWPVYWEPRKEGE